jgi:hypothetical protein
VVSGGLWRACAIGDGRVGHALIFNDWASRTKSTTMLLDGAWTDGAVGYTKLCTYTTYICCCFGLKILPARALFDHTACAATSNYSITSLTPVLRTRTPSLRCWLLRALVHKPLKFTRQAAPGGPIITLVLGGKVTCGSQHPGQSRLTLPLTVIKGRLGHLGH